VADPKGMIAKFIGQPLPESLSVSVHEETPGSLHFVIPAKPPVQALEELNDADLEKIAGGTDPLSLTLVGTMIAASVVTSVLGTVAIATGSVVASASLGILGRVDGFNQHQPARKTDDG
jgi:hypothetical protein